MNIITYYLLLKRVLVHCEKVVAHQTVSSYGEPLQLNLQELKEVPHHL